MSVQQNHNARQIRRGKKLIEEIAELKEKVGQLRDESHQAQIKAAVTETQVAAMEKV